MTPSQRLSPRIRMLLALSCALGATLLLVPSLQAAGVNLQPLADKEPSLPLTAAFEKVASNEGTPVVLKLKNDSKGPLKVSGKVLLAVVHHAMDKARPLPEQTIESGQTMTIKDLSSDDRVLLSAPGFAPLEIRVPFKI